MIKRIYIDNYKCFVNFELRFADLTLLAGQNGSGKTGVLDVIYAVRSLLEGKARITDTGIFPLSSLTRWQSRDTQTIEIEVRLADDEFVYRLEVEHARRERRARILLETLTSNGGPLFTFQMGEVQLYKDDHSLGSGFGSDWRESALARVVPIDKNTRLTRFLDFFRAILLCGPNPTTFAREASGEENALSRDGQNFVGWYRQLVQERQHLVAQHTKAMQQAIAGLHGFRLERVGIDTRALVGVFGDDVEAPELGFHEMSDGQRVLMLLYSLTTLTAHQGHVLMVDEPVNYVGLREIQPWLVTLADACGTAFPQAVLCSHHPEVIDYLGPEHGVLLWRDGFGPARCEELIKGLKDWNKDESLELSELMARGWER